MWAKVPTFFNLSFNIIETGGIVTHRTPEILSYFSWNIPYTLAVLTLGLLDMRVSVNANSTLGENVRYFKIQRWK